MIVTATFRDDTQVTGVLLAWGTQVIRINATRPGKSVYTERSTATLGTVVEAVR